jgi:hypothetical protein
MFQETHSTSKRNACAIEDLYIVKSWVPQLLLRILGQHIRAGLPAK